jgi:hypothetical protein
MNCGTSGIPAWTNKNNRKGGSESSGIIAESRYQTPESIPGI